MKSELTKFQSRTRDVLQEGKSVLLIAPTGLGKTLAVTADLQDKFTKTIYSVPLRALGVGIRDAIRDLARDGKSLDPKIHHGDTQESKLFGEEVVVATYDQVVCGIPGLPLSLPLRAGHAVAGALLMSRLILDEVHLAWGISPKALSILLGIVDFRKKLGLQTVVQTATLPDKVAEEISKQFEMELLIVGKDDLSDDKGLALREKNRHVAISRLELSVKGKGDQKQLDYSPLDEKLLLASSKRIYFANTVERLQLTYDRLLKAGIERETIIVLHNRMPRSWREQAESLTRERFGKGGKNGNWLLLTNQVAEAGLDISAPLVISDPAPVDTLVQRAGRCARWFRSGEVFGEFSVIVSTKNYLEDPKKGLAIPYRKELVHAALDSLPKDLLTWKTERDWVNVAWGGDPEKALQQVQNAIDGTAFALNLFDRAAQERSPGMIASAFREIVSVEIAIAEANEILDREKFQQLLNDHRYPETSSVSLRRAWGLATNPLSRARAIRYEEGSVRIEPAAYVRPGDVLLISSDVAVLHRDKGLCFVDSPTEVNSRLIHKQSEWTNNKAVDESLSREGGKSQGLFEHTKEVMEKTYEKLTSAGCYREALIKILKSLEPNNIDALADTIAKIATVAAGLHDLGKADKEWQERIRRIEPRSEEELIGRTNSPKAGPIGRPHTPPAFLGTLKACEILLGNFDTAGHLIRCIALAAARHHSSLTNPDFAGYTFCPHPKAREFVEQMLRHSGASDAVCKRAGEIIQEACRRPSRKDIPLALPNDDLFPIYALVGRAILISDRESAAGKTTLESWKAGEQ